jgi:hypothetical protein
MAPDTADFSRFGEVDPQDLESVYQRLRAGGVPLCPTIVVFKTGAHMSAIKSGYYPQSEYVLPMVLDSWKSQWVSQEDIPDSIWRNWVQMVKGFGTKSTSLNLYAFAGRWKFPYVLSLAQSDGNLVTGG